MKKQILAFLAIMTLMLTSVMSASAITEGSLAVDLCITIDPFTGEMIDECDYYSEPEYVYPDYYEPEYIQPYHYHDYYNEQEETIDELIYTLNDLEILHDDVVYLIEINDELAELAWDRGDGQSWAVFDRTVENLEDVLYEVHFAIEDIEFELRALGVAVDSHNHY